MEMYTSNVVHQAQPKFLNTDWLNQEKVVSKTYLNVYQILYNHKKIQSEYFTICFSLVFKAA